MECIVFSRRQSGAVVSLNHESKIYVLDIRDVAFVDTRVS